LIQATTELLLHQAIERFWETVPPTFNQVRNNLRRIAIENFEISVEQFHILRHIRKGIKSVSELAEVKKISRPAISQGVEQLVEKGYISRQQSAKDRRYVKLELTQSGNDLLNTIFERNSCWMLEKMAALDTEELNCLIKGMEVLNKTFNPSLDQTDN
jgi:DNA-binding MarR family transcriptional regulator